MPMTTSCGSEFVFAAETTRCNPLRQTASESVNGLGLAQTWQVQGSSVAEKTGSDDIV